MIVFNGNLKREDLEEFTKENIEPLFKKLEEMTAAGEADWKKTDELAPYETSIIKEDNEQWHIKIFDRSPTMLMIEWTHYNNKKKKKIFRVFKML